MTRFILLSFAFLGWGFWELSGGADYAPRVAAEPIFAAVPARASVAPDTASALRISTPSATTSGFNTATTTGNAAQVLQAALVTDAVTPLPAAPHEAPETTETRIALTFQPAPLQGLSPAGLGTTTGDGAPVSITTFGGTERDTVRDLREISGARVNMRAGPGTRFSVLGKLSRGDTVEVVGADAAGWLKLRVVETGKIGYIADTLVSARAE